MVDTAAGDHPALATRSTRRRAVAAAAVLGVAAGWLTALVEPRGPTTTTQGLLAMGIGLAVGVAAGYLTGRRWSFWVTAAAYILAFELGRRGTVGPTIEDLRVDSPYGILAALVTRGFQGVLVFLPLALGVALGVRRWRAVERAEATLAKRRRPVGVVVLAVVVVALAALVARPASTPPVVDGGGEPVAGSVAELANVPLGGRDHAVLIRAADPDDPVLLYLAGGPGQSDLALSRALTSGWEQDFVVVNLDQRGAGKSYPAIDPVEDLTLQRAVGDVVELAEYLRGRFDERRIYLMGESWGTLLGVLAVQQRPDLFYAWIGSGQMVDVLETDQRVYADLVAYAKRTGDSGLAADLRGVGPPPYRDIPWANANLLTWYEYLYKEYTPSEGYSARGDESGLDPFGVLGTEYTLVEKTNVLRGLIDTFTLMYPQLYDLDLRESASRLEVPVYILDGEAELEGRRALALEWFEGLQAPSKQLVSYANAAHAVAFEQGDEVQRLLTEEIVPATYSR